MTKGKVANWQQKNVLLVKISKVSFWCQCWLFLGPRSTLVKLANDMSSVSLYFVAQTQDSLDDLLVNFKMITGDDFEHSHGFEQVWQPYSKAFYITVHPYNRTPTLCKMLCYPPKGEILEGPKLKNWSLIRNGNKILTFWRWQLFNLQARKILWFIIFWQF